MSSHKHNCSNHKTQRTLLLPASISFFMQLAAEREAEAKKLLEEKMPSQPAVKKDAPLKVYRSGVGKYIPKLETLK